MGNCKRSVLFGRATITMPWRTYLLEGGTDAPQACQVCKSVVAAICGVDTVRELLGEGVHDEHAERRPYVCLRCEVWRAAIRYHHTTGLKLHPAGEEKDFSCILMSFVMFKTYFMSLEHILKNFPLLFP